MRKAVRLRVTVDVRGEDEPAADFAARATRAVREALAAGSAADDGLSFRVRRVQEIDDDEESSARLRCDRLGIGVRWGDRTGLIGVRSIAEHDVE